MTFEIERTDFELPFVPAEAAMRWLGHLLLERMPANAIPELVDEMQDALAWDARSLSAGSTSPGDFDQPVMRILPAIVQEPFGIEEE
jgi:hypothetical protein